MIALAKVCVRCRNDLGFVWSKVEWVPHKDQIICITHLLSRNRKKKPKQYQLNKNRGTVSDASTPPVRSVWHSVKGTWVDTLRQIGFGWSLVSQNAGLAATFLCPCPIGGKHIHLHVIFTAGLCDHCLSTPSWGQTVPDFPVGEEKEQ